MSMAAAASMPRAARVQCISSFKFMEQQSRLPAPTVAAHVFMALQQAEIARAGGSQSSESQSTAELKMNSASCRVVDRLPAGSSLPAPAA